MADPKDTLAEWRKLAESAYDHARLLDKHELLRFLDFVEAAKELRKRWPNIKEDAADRFDVALAALEPEKGET